LVELIGGAGLFPHVVLTILLMVFALWLRLEIAPVDAGLQYVTFFPAVTLAAIMGGYRTGLLATSIGLVLATYIFTPPYYSFAEESLKLSLWGNLVFLLDGLVVSVSIEMMHRFRKRSERELWLAEQAEARLSAANVELHQALKELDQAHEQLRLAAIAFDTHEAIMITDAKANIIRVNPAFERTTGYSEAEVLGKNPRLLNSGAHDKAFYQEMWKKLLAKGSWEGELWDRNKNGQIYPKQVTITAVKNEAGETMQYVSIFNDITARKQAEEEIRNLAFYDALTGLPNRRMLQDRLALAISQSVRDQQYGALLFLDMDKFKGLNDAMGHEYGDMLLVKIAKRLRLCVREVDTVARLGGDEFVVILEGIGHTVEEASQRAAQVAEKIRAVLATPFQLKEHLHHNSPSIGVYPFMGDGDPLEELIKRADLAMYKAKELGRNRVCFFDIDMQQSVERHARLEADLRVAIAEGQLRLYYQLQVDGAQQPVGAEALVRWQHPQRGMVSPAQFIPVAEESSLILDIGQWVLETACAQVANWSQDAMMRDLVVAVNISAKQFKQADFVERVRQAIERYGIPPARLKLELTESVALQDIVEVVGKMRSLREEVGVTLSLDDFSTGYSSLSYLKKLPLDQVKIDQSFVRDIASNHSDAEMVKTIIDMARNFELNVIAEGVETAEQFHLLKDSGCQAYQGYLFGKPMPAEAFEAALMQEREVVA
jgi:diguanylate cyclase (GGDEF)-like protein/PAS domain S-box-containing protein